MRILVIVAFLVFNLQSCKSTTSDSTVKDDIILVGPDGKVFVVKKSEDDIVVRRCNDLIVIQSPQELDQKCPRTSDNERSWPVEDFTRMVHDTYYSKFVHTEQDWKVQEDPKKNGEDLKAQNRLAIAQIESFLKAYPGAGGKWEAELAQLKSQNDQLDSQIAVSKSYATFISTVFPKLINKQPGVFVLSTGKDDQVLLVQMLQEAFRVSSPDKNPVKLFNLAKVSDIDTHRATIVGNKFYFTKGQFLHDVFAADLNFKGVQSLVQVKFSSFCPNHDGTINADFYHSEAMRAFGISNDGGKTFSPYFYCGFQNRDGNAGKLFDSAGKEVDQAEFIKQNKLDFVPNTFDFYEMVLGAGGSLSNWYLATASDGILPGYKVFLNPSHGQIAWHQEGILEVRSAYTIAALKNLGLAHVTQDKEIVLKSGENVFNLTPNSLKQLLKKEGAKIASVMVGPDANKIFLVLKTSGDATTYEVWSLDVAYRN